MDTSLIKTAGKTILSTEVVNIGCAADNQLIINDPDVEAHHAQMRFVGQAYGIMDLGSRHGTFVNKKLLLPNTPCMLNSGDVISLGDTVLCYEVNGSQHTLTPYSSSTQKENGAYSQALRVATNGSSNINNTVQQAYHYSPPVNVPSSSFIGANEMSQSHPVPLTFTSLLQKENRRTLWFALGITAVVLMIAVIIFGNLHSPGKTLDTACSALKSGDYQTLYNQFAPGFLTETQLINDFGNAKVVTCTYGSLNMSGNTATTTVTFSTDEGGTYNDIVYLIQDSSFDWKIYDVR